jgi:hypothetical protein
LNVEKRHRNIRDSLLVELGENPSFNYAEEHKQHSDHEGEQHISEGIAELQKDVAEAKIRMEKLAEEKAAELAEAAILAASEAAIDEVPTLDNPPEEVVEEEEKPKSKKRVSHKPGSKTYQNLQAIKYSVKLLVTADESDGNPFNMDLELLMGWMIANSADIQVMEIEES